MYRSSCMSFYQFYFMETISIRTLASPIQKRLGFFSLEVNGLTSYFISIPKGGEGEKCVSLCTLNGFL